MSVHLWLWCLRMVRFPDPSTFFKFAKQLTNWFVLYVAGGQAINSKMDRMLTVVPEHIHDRSGIFMCSYDEVQKVIDIYNKHASAKK